MFIPMKYEQASLTEMRGKFDEEEHGTLITPMEDTKVTEQLQEELSHIISRFKRGDGWSEDLFSVVDAHPDRGDEAADICEINIQLLAKILYEYRRYEQASNFSDAQMDVLRSVEFHDAERVGVDEVMESPHAKQYAESTVYKSLKRLTERGLVKKIRPGVYRYDGP
jgi:DNA-binding transcriptional ArsR family regulator